MDEMQSKEIDGEFEVVSDPPTFVHVTQQKQKAEFAGLSNDLLYRFRVVARNRNFEVESEWTRKVRPDRNKTKRQFKEDKERVIDEIMKKRREFGAKTDNEANKPNGRRKRFEKTRSAARKKQKIGSSLSPPRRRKPKTKKKAVAKAKVQKKKKEEDADDLLMNQLYLELSKSDGNADDDLDLDLDQMTAVMLSDLEYFKSNAL